MNAQSVMMDSRLTHVRELQAEVKRLRAELQAERAEREALESHFALALAAAEDLKAIPAGGRLVIYDGWNLILGAHREADNREELIAQAQAQLAAHPDDRAWIVLDGPEAKSTVEGRLRVTYTGGTGLHRADRMILDYVKMAHLRGFTVPIEVKTRDKDLLAGLGKV